MDDLIIYKKAQKYKYKYFKLKNELEGGMFKPPSQTDKTSAEISELEKQQQQLNDELKELILKRVNLSQQLMSPLPYPPPLPVPIQSQRFMSPPPNLPPTPPFQRQSVQSQRLMSPTPNLPPTPPFQQQSVLSQQLMSPLPYLPPTPPFQRQTVLSQRLMSPPLNRPATPIASHTQSVLSQQLGFLEDEIKEKREQIKQMEKKLQRVALKKIREQEGLPQPQPQLEPRVLPSKIVEQPRRVELVKYN